MEFNNRQDARIFGLLKSVVDNYGGQNTIALPVRKRRRTGRSSGSSYYSSGSRSGKSNATSLNVRFNDMGDRGGVTTSRYKRRRRRKLPYKKRRRIRRFKRAVRKVFKEHQSISTLQEFWNGQFTINANTADTFESTMAGNVQTIWGNASTWGLNLGEAAASADQENQFIAEEMAAYRPVINDVPVIRDFNDVRDFAKFWVQRKYLKLTIRNTSVDRDLIFDLYECVANKNIADSNYANPVIAWDTCVKAVAPFATELAAGRGEAYIKGTEPTDCPLFGRYWKIIQKQKVRIPPGGTVVNPYQTFKMSSGKYLYDGAKANSLWALKGKTKYFMMILDPEQSGSASRYGGTDPVCAVVAHRNTHYKPFNRVGQMQYGVYTPNWIRLTNNAPTL